MGVHKVTWFFEGRNRGWTESLWQETDALHSATLKLARNLAMRRTNLLGKECKIKAIRVSTEAEGPDALLHYEEFTPHESVVENAAHPDVGILIRCNNALDKRWKHIFLRGFWDRIELENGKYLKDDEKWRLRMDAYLRKLIDDNWCWMGVVNQPKVKLTGYTSDALDRITYTFPDDVFPALRVGKNDYIRISGANGKSRANGKFAVEVIDRRTCITVKPRAVGLYRHGGFGVYSTLAPIHIATADDQKTCERKAGAPLLESPGRLKAKPQI